VREALTRRPGARTDLDRGLWATLKTLKQRAVLFVISDFLDSLPTSALKAAAARHDVVLLELVDPRDHQLPAVGPVMLRDSETGGLAVVSGRRAGRLHAIRRAEGRAALQRLTRKLAIDHLEIRTDRPYLGTLIAFFERRRKRLTR